jgi:parallel beta-helix repeat protein
VLWGIQVGNENPRYASNIKILDNKVSGCPTYGIYILNTKNSLVNNNIITGVTATGDTGIYLDATTLNIQGSGNTITGCTLSVVNNGSGNNVS